MKSNDKIKELSDIIKNARKYSLIGEYGNSLEKYQEAIGIIKQRQKEIINENEDLKEKWKMTEYNIKSEMLQIKDILETCLQLHHCHFNYTKKQLEGNECIFENKKIMEKEIIEMYNKDKRIYDKIPDNNTINNNKNIIRSNKSNKVKNKIIKTNLTLESKKNKVPKINPWISKNSSNNSRYNKSYINTENNINSSTNKTNNNSNNNSINNLNIKKCKSLKVNMEKKMFNPLEEFYGLKPDNKDSKNYTNNNCKESKINGNSYINRKNELIQQKLNVQKVTPFYTKADIKKDYSKEIENKNNYSDKITKKIKVVQIDLDEKDIVNNEHKMRNNDINYNLKKDEKTEENLDMIEHFLNNLSKFNIDNNDDSF